ncbi:hypothetical protein Ciccas_009959, partial [Cichlidogyrus casuarinus]
MESYSPSHPTDQDMDLASDDENNVKNDSYEQVNNNNKTNMIPLTSGSSSKHSESKRKSEEKHAKSRRRRSRSRSKSREKHSRSKDRRRSRSPRRHQRRSRSRERARRSREKSPARRRSRSRSKDRNNTQKWPSNFGQNAVENVPKSFVPPPPMQAPWARQSRPPFPLNNFFPVPPPNHPLSKVHAFNPNVPPPMMGLNIPPPPPPMVAPKFSIPLPGALQTIPLLPKNPPKQPNNVNSVPPPPPPPLSNSKVLQEAVPIKIETGSENLLATLLSKAGLTSSFQAAETAPQVEPSTPMNQISQMLDSATEKIIGSSVLDAIKNNPMPPGQKPSTEKTREEVKARLRVLATKNERSMFADKHEWQDRIALEVKSYLKPAFVSRKISKDDYMEIMKKTVTKISRSGLKKIDTDRIG